MFFDFQIEVPDAPGLLVRKKRGSYYSVEYEYGTRLQSGQTVHLAEARNDWQAAEQR